MGLLEENPLAGKLVDVGSLRLSVPTETTNPVVQIVDGDEQDVRPVDRVGGRGPLVRWNESDEECNRREAYESLGLSHCWFEIRWN